MRSTGRWSIWVKTMAEYIKRSDALKVIETANSMASSFLEATMKLCVTMDRIAAADVVPVRHGRWVLNRNLICVGDDFGHWICSECAHEAVFGDKQFDLNRYIYCPNCGARMDGGEP